MALGYHTPQSGSKRLFIFTYNTTARVWQRLTTHASIVDDNSRLVKTKLEHFSLYAVMLEEIGFTSAPTPTPPPPPPPPPPASIVLPIVYSLGGLFFGVLVTGGAVWQVMRFRERQRLRVVALEEAEKKRSEAGDAMPNPCARTKSCRIFERPHLGAVTLTLCARILYPGPASHADSHSDSVYWSRREIAAEEDFDCPWWEVTKEDPVEEDPIAEEKRRRKEDKQPRCFAIINPASAVP